MGRVTHAVTLNAVGKKELREILDSENSSPLIDLFDLAYYMDVNLELTEDKREKIVDEAIKLGTGVRGLRTAAELILFDGVL
jgi:ATP-dependent protease Clp ATPase subunit